MVRSPKIYVVDPLLVCSVTRQPSPEAALAGPMAGAFVEGLLAMDTVKAFLDRGEPPATWFWRSHDGTKVDLFVQFGTTLVPVEIKRTASPGPGHVEGLRRFTRFAGDDVPHPGALVRDVDQEGLLPGGVRVMPWRRWGATMHALLDRGAVGEVGSR